MPLSTPPASLTTDRLVLRPWSTDDTALAVAGDRAADWAEDFPSGPDRMIAGLIAERPDWRGPYGHRLVVERETGQVVGSIGLKWPPKEGVLELGYGIAPGHRGRGYATEAARAVAEFGLTAPGVHTVSAEVHPSNPASARVLEKAGFVRWETEEPLPQNMIRFRFVPGSPDAS
ncbi:GNAT family N-acetyltransferase [Streptomyces sp. NPDC090025]|uniref:GNAT family N-acetyltransferase n=1 Tax=Streptomyces sp. NPDC090025 TaxID=3365922 RepID=UPI0038364B9E